MSNTTHIPHMVQGTTVIQLTEPQFQAMIDSIKAELRTIVHEQSDDELLTVAEAAQVLKMGETAVRERLYSGQIRGHKTGKKWLISKKQLLKDIQDNGRRPLFSD